MNIKIVAVGKIKEKFTKDAIDEFTKRLGAYCSLSLIEIPAQEIKDDNLATKYMNIEGEKILSAIKQDAYVITLEINGKMLSSEDFAQKIKDLSYEGHNEIVFVIGGANGLAKEVSDRANFKLSFSKMTFTHQLIRVFLYEQIYRAFKINNNESYHR
jgi:23S rRNA (pseudouridine1915-N3)-methyltransferase